MPETVRFIAFFFAVTIGTGIAGGIITSWIESLGPKRCPRCHGILSLCQHYN